MVKTTGRTRERFRMQAIILAAGMGKRLGRLTGSNTKFMVEVNGITLAERMLSQLDSKGLSRIVIVAGYEGQKLKDYIGKLGIKTPVLFVDNTVYDKTNNIYSLALAKEYLCSEDTLLFEADIIFEDQVLDMLINDPRETLAIVDKYEAWMDGTCVKLDENDRITGFIAKDEFCFDESGEYYKTVNLYKFGREFSQNYYVPFLEAYLEEMGENEYYEQVLKVIAALEEPGIQAMRLSGQRWYEIDDVQDLDIAESLFAADDDRLKLIKERYGGYWRYPKMRDFCYLINPYFPTKRMTDEMKANFEVLISQYPSGMKVNSLLAGKCFGINSENIVAGNGASELIRSLLQQFRGRTGFVKPTFDEYPNRYDEDKSVYFCSGNPDCSYSADDLMHFIDEQDIDNLVIVNPDNPGGNYICKNDIIRLVKYCKEKDIRLVTDESFSDFSDEENATLLEQDFIEENIHLYVVKSISKAYGVPGLRLGVLASGDTEMINSIKKEVSIWNINSFAEFFMQIIGKYRKDYDESLVKLKTERKRFTEELKKIRGIHVIPSQADFVMVRTDAGSEQLTKALLLKYNILVKDLSEKMQGQNYLRFAIRNTEENDLLLQALRNESEGT